MLTFNGDPQVKAMLVNRMRDHAAAGRLVQGVYWNGQGGCAVGCMVARGSELEDGVQNYSCSMRDHIGTRFGLNETILRALEQCFEYTRAGACADIPLEFLEAIPVGIQLDFAAFAQASSHWTCYPSFQEAWLSGDIGSACRELFDWLRSLSPEQSVPVKAKVRRLVVNAD